MKKEYYLGAALCLLVGTNLNAQSMSEDFESWSVGSYMGVNSTEWTTWSGATGGAEDVQVSNAQAFSGSNSIYFSSTLSTGGPQDVIVPFGGEHTTGHFNFSAMFYVDNNQGAYFNFQGENTPGQLWSFNCQMLNDGTIYFTDGIKTFVTGTYPSATWFEIEVDVDLNTDFWEILVDGTSLGKFQSEVNQIATLDLFPVNAAASGGNDNSSFYVDDLSYTYTPFTLPAVNGAVTYIGDRPLVAGPPDVAGVVGASFRPYITMRNNGTTTITSFDLEIAHNGATLTESITGVSIASLQSYNYQFMGTIPLTSGQNDVSVTILNVNGNVTDDHAADDSKSLPVDPVTPADGKVVVIEEATGTWCQFCPRGAVMMDRMEYLYPDQVATIAVHNSDPMTYDIYDIGVSGLVGGAYPNSVVDRGPAISVQNMHVDFINQIQIAPTALISVGANWNGDPGILEVSVTADFQSTVTGPWKLALVITEDSVTGTSGGYGQSNAYANNALGPMGGYESLPGTVPASQMVYDHVARVIMPDFNGHENSFPTTNAGDVHTVVFKLWIDPSWDLDKLHLVGMLIDNTGDIDNASSVSLNEAALNEFITSSEEVLSSDVFDAPDVDYKLFPNPASDMAMITLSNVTDEAVVLTIYDLNGKEVAKKDYGTLNGAISIPINCENFAPGLYTINLSIGDEIMKDKLIVR